MSPRNAPQAGPSSEVSILERHGEVNNAGDGVEQTEQWRTNVQPQSFSEEDEGVSRIQESALSWSDHLCMQPPISIEQFFSMTGIRFMDELTAPRRSTIHPSQMQSLRRRSSLSETDVPLSDYVIAMSVDVPQLELYSHVAKDLQLWIEHSKDIYKQAEEEATKFTPALFREYSMADEEIKEELLVRLTELNVWIGAYLESVTAPTETHQSE